MKRFKTLGVWMLILIASLFVFGIVGVSAQDSRALFVTAMPLPLLGGVIFGRKIFDWKGIKEYKSLDEKKEKIIEAADICMKKINEAPLVKISGMKMRGPDADLSGEAPVVVVMSDAIKTPDRGYEMIFGEVDMRASSNDAFDMLDVSGGATFYQVKPGEEVTLTKIGKAVKTAVGYLRFAGGLNILDDWLRFNKYYLIDQLFEDTIRKWWTGRATLFYGLLAALGAGINEAFDTDDITTINNACVKILGDLEAAGFPVDENAQFVITCNPKLKARILKALKTTFETQGVNKQVVFNIPTVVTSTKVANTSYYVSLPDFKNKRGEWEDLTARPAQRDELHLGAVHVWTGAYNGIIGESKQHRRCALS